MAPVIGNMLAELVQGGKPELLVDELRASRFVSYKFIDFFHIFYQILLINLFLFRIHLN